MKAIAFCQRLHDKEKPVPIAKILPKIPLRVPVVEDIVCYPNTMMPMVISHPTGNTPFALQFDIWHLLQQRDYFLCSCTDVHFSSSNNIFSHDCSVLKITLHSSTIRQHGCPNTQLLNTSNSQTCLWNHQCVFSSTNIQANVWCAGHWQYCCSISGSCFKVSSICSVVIHFSFMMFFLQK